MGSVGSLDDFGTILEHLYELGNHVHYVINPHTRDVKMKVDVDHVVCGMTKVNSTRASNNTDAIFETIEEESSMYSDLPTKGGILNPPYFIALHEDKIPETTSVRKQNRLISYNSFNNVCYIIQRTFI